MTHEARAALRKVLEAARRVPVKRPLSPSEFEEDEEEPGRPTQDTTTPPQGPLRPS